jgi:rhamnosyltransferase
MKPIGICAVVVTHNPDSDLGQSLRITSQQVGHVVVVDNASATIHASALPEICRGLANAEMVRLDSNIGLAAAQNTGIRRAIHLGCHWTLLLDQDSQPAPDMVGRMVEVYERQPAMDRVAIIAPNIADPRTSVMARFLRPRGRLLFERTPCQGNQIDDVTIVISSGALISNAVYLRLGPFREDYFIDYVDTEYCLRAVNKGFRITVACGATLAHRLGNPRLRKVGPLPLYPRFHSPARWYYIARNRVPTVAQYSLRFPHWFLFEFVSSCYHLLRMMALEDRRLEKLQAVLAGTFDGIRGKMGRLHARRESRWN